MQDRLRRQENSIQILYNALQETLQAFTEANVNIDNFQTILNQLYR